MPDVHTLNRSMRTAVQAEAVTHPAPPVLKPGGGLGFETALQFIKLGYRAQRAGWNGRGMWIEIVTDWTTDRLTSADGQRLPWIVMKTADGSWVPWLASQSDLLSHDWVVIGHDGAEISEATVPLGATPQGNQ